MKNKMKFNPFIRTVVLLSTIIIAVIVIAISLFYYVFSIPEPRGLSPATWVSTFTDNFSFWIETEDERVIVRETGLARLDEYRLWIQIIDETGHEVFSHNKPEHYPVSYSASELIALSTRGYEQGNSIFVSTFDSTYRTYSYIIGFPYGIGRITVYFNYERLQRFTPVVSIIILAAFSAFVLFGFCYGIWLSRKVSIITGGINNILSHTYQPLKKSGIFGEIYGALNEMDIKIKNTDKLQKETEQTRREWIANITHDLKTPLSPIKGYAELLEDMPETEHQTVQEYGSIILKNANYAEKLINDLKLTYQLDSGVMPFNPQRIGLVRYLKELVIDIMNDPAFSARNIQFESNMSDFEISIDIDLFRRAVQNLIINALIHNTNTTKVTVSVSANSQGFLCISIRDNGTGMTETERLQIFERY